MTVTMVSRRRQHGELYNAQIAMSGQAIASMLRMGPTFRDLNGSQLTAEMPIRLTGTLFTDQRIDGEPRLPGRRGLPFWLGR